MCRLKEAPIGKTPVELGNLTIVYFLAFYRRRLRLWQEKTFLGLFRSVHTCHAKRSLQWFCQVFLCLQGHCPWDLRSRDYMWIFSELRTQQESLSPRNFGLLDPLRSKRKCWEGNKVRIDVTGTNPILKVKLVFSLYIIQVLHSTALNRTFISKVICLH